MLNVEALEEKIKKIQNILDDNEKENQTKELKRIIMRNIKSISEDIENIDLIILKTFFSLNEEETNNLKYVKSLEKNLENKISNLDLLEGEEYIKAETNIINITEILDNIREKNPKLKKIHKLEEKIIGKKEILKQYKYYLKQVS